MFNQVFLKAYQRGPRQNDANITFIKGKFNKIETFLRIKIKNLQL